MNRNQEHGKKNRGEWELISTSPQETEDLGRLLGSMARADDVICLDGDLGAGKTALTRGIARGLGVTGIVASPTFTILIEHAPGLRGLALFHFDAYRLDGAESFYAEGFDEYFSMNGVSVIEWSSRIDSAVPEQSLFVQLFQDRPDMPDERRVCLCWPSDPKRLIQLRQNWEQVRESNADISG